MGKNNKSPFTTKSIMDYRGEIFGIAMVLIVIYHLYNRMWLGDINSLLSTSRFFVYLKHFIENFRIGVDAFLFLSAIGLYHSMSKNTVSKFYINRVKRVVVPCLIMFIPYYIYLDFFYKHKGCLNFLLDVTTINYWVPGVTYSFWYIAFILLVYALYPWLFKLDKKTKHISTYVLFVFSILLTIYINLRPTAYTKQIETAISRIPIFMFGMVLSPVLNKERKIPWWIVLSSFILWLTSLVFLIRSGSNELYRLLGSAFAVLSIILFSWLMNIGGKFMYTITTPFRFIGKFTLEIYILHLILANLVQIIIGWDIIHDLPINLILNGFICIAIIFGLSLLLAMAVQSLTKLISKGKKKNVTMH